MTTRIALVTDIHLPERDGASQDAALDWALDFLSVEKPDVVVVAGDVTATGSFAAAQRARTKLDRAGLPLLVTPGNSDRRQPDEWESVRRVLSTPESFLTEDCAVVVLDSSDRTITVSDRTAFEAAVRKAGNRRAVLVSHHGPALLADESREWLDRFLEAGAVDLYLCGHHHVDGEGAAGRATVHHFRGLDPDKACGGPPAIHIFELDGGKWSKRGISFPGGDVTRWPPDARAQFIDLLGASCMKDTLGGLAECARRKVRRVELRYARVLEVPRHAIADAVKRWRDTGGGTLSIHMPDLSWDEETGSVSGSGVWNDTMEAALSLDVDALTVHVPKVAIGLMRPTSAVWDAILTETERLLRPAIERNMIVGVENLRMKAGEKTDDRRRFGYLPDECLGWIKALRETTNSKNIGFVLDVGHAHNNAPFSTEFTLSQWYARMGSATVGYHLHQVSRDMRNHGAILDVFGPMISFSSFFWAWRMGQLNAAPIYLEMHDPTDTWASLEYLRKLFA